MGPVRRIPDTRHFITTDVLAIAYFLRIFWIGDERDAIEIRPSHNIIGEEGSCIIMKSVLLAAGFVILFWGQDIYAQPPDTAWTQTFGGADWDVGYCVQQTTDGGYIITGFTDSYGAGLNDVYLIKTDSNGDTLWTQTFGGSGYDYGLSVQQTTPDNGYIIAGYTMSYGAGINDVYLIKTDSNGDTLWTKTFGGSDYDVGYCVQQTTDEGYIITGFTTSYGAGGRDVYLVKTDSNGDTLWTNTYGGADWDVGRCVQQTTDGGFIVAGSTMSYGAGGYDIYLIKTDSSGDTLWTQAFGDTGYNESFSVQQTSDGGYIVAGATEYFGPGGHDVALLKTDSSGDSLWARTFGGSGYDHGFSVQQTTDGGFIVAGSSTSFSKWGDNDVYLIKTDSNGDTLWTQTFGSANEDNGSSVQQISSGGYIVTGDTQSYGAGGFDVYLIKLEPEYGIEEENEGSSPLVTLESIDPNPFSSELSITYSIPEQTRVELTIFDLSGRLIDELINDQLPAGTHTVIWNPSESIPIGCYLIEFNACGHHTVGRCLKLN